MKRVLIIVVLIVAVGASCYFYKTSQKKKEANLFGEVPEKCLPFKENICDLFNCMIDSCWCDELSFPSAILTLEDKEVLNEKDATTAVKEYLEISGSEYIDIRKAVRLNSFFFNVFAYTEEKKEKVFTIAADGTIFIAICNI